MYAQRLERLKTLSVLYVEDDEATREELAMILEVWVGQLHLGANGKEGLELFARHRPDVVITDIQMPLLNGLSMSAEIRRMVPEQFVVVLSAYNDMEFLFRAIDIGINHYITKPVSVERLLGKLAELVTQLDLVREQQKTQHLLEQYRTLVDQSAAVMKLDAERRITYVNDQFTALAGYQAQALVGQPASMLRHESEEPGRIEDIWQQVLAGRNWSGVMRNRRRNGDLYVVESSLVPILDDQGVLTEVVCLDVDITDLHLNYETLAQALGKSEHSLKEQRHYLAEYKRALELGTCICMTDSQNAIVSVNRQFSSLLGYSAMELRGSRLASLVPDYDPEDLPPASLEGEVHYSQVLRFLHKDGSERVFSVAFVAVRDLVGQLDSMILLCQDITESLRLTRDLMETQRELLFVMGEVVENRSPETGQHVKRVAEISRLLALKCGLSEEHADLIKVAAPMHDVGKVGIPDHILHKPGKLDQDEFEQMKSHARLGYQILKDMDRPMVQLGARIAHEHHEHYDGRGYPNGLAGEDISLEGRIVAIADVFDALSQDRVYKEAWEEERIRRYFLEQRGAQFDPRLVDLLFQHWDEVIAIRDRYRDA